MLFASFPFILVFLPLVVVGCLVLKRLLGARAAQLWVLAASICFYCWSRPSNLIFLVASILANWMFAHWMECTTGPAKKRVLVLGLTLNILYLCAFKYLGFLASTFSFAMPHGFAVPAMPFPLGISFFTVTQIMYLVDCYEGALDAGSLLDHASFVAFFPYLISGPLGRTKRIRHQFGNFGNSEGTRAKMLSRGIFLFSMGLFKKAVFADSFARVASYGYNWVHHRSAAEAWIFSVSYALQLYYDFSAYSDMAIGSAIMLGIEIPRNFDRPYRATSITEFWERWHISLTQFITSYLYTPILRNFKRKPLLRENLLFASVMATLLAMGIAGLWHGAAWTFLIYGFLHGAYLGINQIWRKQKFPKIPAFPSWLLTFVAVLISTIFFNAHTVGQATERVLNLFNPHQALDLHNLSEMTVGEVSLMIYGAPLFVGCLAAFFGPSSEQMAREFQPTALNCAYTVLLIVVSFLFLNSSVPATFIYFRF